MSQSNTAQFQRLPSITLKSFYAICDFFALLSAAWTEAKLMEQKSYKNTANW